MFNGVIYHIKRGIKKIKFAVTYYMGCKKILSYRRYDSSSRHDIIIGGISKRITVVVIRSRFGTQFDAEYKRIEDSEEHYFPKTFERSYRIIEDDAIMKIV